MFWIPTDITIYQRSKSTTRCIQQCKLGVVYIKMVHKTKKDYNQKRDKKVD